MNRDAKRLLAIGVLLLLGLSAAVFFYQRSEQEQQATGGGADAERLVRPHSHSQGPLTARVTVVEFLDPECETCRAMYPLVKRIQSELGSSMRLVVRYMPLHPNSVYAAGTLEAAAAQGRFWEFLEVLLANQPVWGDHRRPRPELIPEYARQLGLDMQAFEAFLEAGDYRELVEQDRQDGLALGVRGTPSFFVNGRELDELGYESLKQLIEEELNAPPRSLGGAPASS